MDQRKTTELSGAEEYQRLLTLLDERRFDEAQIRGRVLLETGEIGLLVRAKTHNLLCWTFIEGLKRVSPEAVLHGEEAVRLAAVLGERSLQVQAMCNLASAYHQAGDYEPAVRTYREILALLTPNPGLLPFGQVIAYQGLAQIEVARGNPREALALLDTARALCQDEEGRFMLADLYRRRALILLKLNQPEEAAQTLQLIQEDAFATGPRSLWWKTHLRFTKARVELALGHWGSTRPQVVNTLALARELGDLPVMAECMCLLALCDAAEGRREGPRRARTALTYAIHSGRRDVVDDVRERLKELLCIDI